jgi:cellulose synthase (UDP-forming)
MKEQYSQHVWVFRILAILTLGWGAYYLFWRFTNTLNMSFLWLSLLLVLCEVYSFFDTLLFVLMLWKPSNRREAPTPIEASVDVYIVTYNEPAELLRLTADAAMRIDWQDKHVYILDDGSRPHMKALAEELGCGYITRGEEWDGKPRHAKAGNINNALLQTEGEFILILDADQIPAPAIIKHTIGYMSNPKVAFVQTPQYFYNLPPGDPFGSDAPLFYGPIQTGKDGWNAATFCGSNAILRREALLQLGLSRFVYEMENDMKEKVVQLRRELRGFRMHSPLQKAAMLQLKSSLRAANKALQSGQSLEAVGEMARKAVTEAQQSVALKDYDQIVDALAELGAKGDQSALEARQFILENKAQLAAQTAPSEPEAVGLSGEAYAGLTIFQEGEAIPIHSLSVISVTEDTATALRLHAMGWESVFHGEILAYGLAPEDLGTAMRQRLRWAQGTIQVFMRENPLFVKGLTLAQKLLYFNMIYSYFGGFVNLIYMLVPILFLFVQFSAVSSWSWGFVLRLLPLLILNRIMFMYIARGLSANRGEQYSIALFPIWIQAILSVVTGAKLSFEVTPKQRQSGNYLTLIWPQLTVMLLTASAILYGIYTFAAGVNTNLVGILINIFWCGYNIVLLSTIVRSALYKPPSDWNPRPPEFLFPKSQSS